ncbi:MAG: enoyl-CoA hydratase [Pseudomonadota bacterium]|nr:enoyl-CoA hydratase [Pseudomonadota bacterium]
MNSHQQTAEFVERDDTAIYETGEPVLYAVSDGIASVTMNRPQFNNAQNSQMTYALDAAFQRAVNDDAVKVIVLRGAGRQFSAGHDIGTPGRDINKSFERKSGWYDHVNKPGGEFLYAREQEVYLGMCRRWRDLPKPTIAMVQGACIAGGLMLAWICDLIVASDDAFFADPVVRMGIPGVEYFAHPYELKPRIAKEFLFLGERMPARRAYEAGMVNRVVPRAELEQACYDIAARVAKMPRMGLALAKQAVNHAEELQGKRAAMDAAFGWHQFAHAHNELVSGDKLGGYDAKAMATSQRGAGNEGGEA